MLLVAVSLVISGRFVIALRLPLPPSCPWLRLSRGCVVLHSDEPETNPTGRVAYTDILDQWEIWWLYGGIDWPGGFNPAWGVVFPIWLLAIPPSCVAAAGFLLNRRVPGPDDCRGCRHPLKGSHICPECGRTVDGTAA